MQKYENFINLSTTNMLSTAQPLRICYYSMLILSETAIYHARDKVQLLEKNH